MSSPFFVQLVNDPFGDPGLYVQERFGRKAFLFDLGDISALSARQILRITDIFVSHTHVDHFIGFDRLLRVTLGRERHLRLYGPPGFIGHVGHRLASYSWNLVERYERSLTFVVYEIHPPDRLYSARFRSETGFVLEPVRLQQREGLVLVDGPELEVRAACLDHRITSLAFALREREHLGIRKADLARLGLEVGPWLQELRTALRAGIPHSTPILVTWGSGASRQERLVPLADLAGCVQRGPGYKLGYVVDAAFHAINIERAVALVAGADVLYIEAPFRHRESSIAADRCHLTARQAGLIARRAGVKRVVPFHFSGRHEGDGDGLRREVEAAFRGELWDSDDVCDP